MKTTYAPFDVAEYLDNDAEYLTATLEDANPQEEPRMTPLPCPMHPRMPPSCYEL